MLSGVKSAANGNAATNAIELTIGQGAKPGGGGMLLGQKISERVAGMRTLPEGVDQRTGVSEPGCVSHPSILARNRALLGFARTRRARPST